MNVRADRVSRFYKFISHFPGSIYLQFIYKKDQVDQRDIFGAGHLSGRRVGFRFSVDRSQKQEMNLYIEGTIKANNRLVFVESIVKRY